jgi:hypothetical protein
MNTRGGDKKVREQWDEGGEVREKDKNKTGNRIERGRQKVD